MHGGGGTCRNENSNTTGDERVEKNIHQHQHAFLSSSSTPRQAALHSLNMVLHAALIKTTLTNAALHANNARGKTLTNELMREGGRLSLTLWVSVEKEMAW